MRRLLAVAVTALLAMPWVGAGSAAAQPLCTGPRVVSVNDVQAPEGNPPNPPTPFTFALTSTGCPTGGTIFFTTVPGTAKAGSDYLPVSGTLFFPPGEPSPRFLAVQVIPDPVNEGNEQFGVHLCRDPTGAVFTGTAGGIGTIVNDDPGPPITLEPVLPDYICSE